MRRDDDRCSKPVERLEQAQHAALIVAVHAAGGLVRQQQPRADNDRARDGEALLLAARQFGGRRVEAVSEAHPVEHFADRSLDLASRGAGDLQGQGNVFPRGQAIDKAEILEHDADLATQLREARARHAGDILAERHHPAARRAMAEEQQAHERRLPRARRPRHELEAAGREFESDVAQHFGAASVAHTHIFEADHGAAPLRAAGNAPGEPRVRRPRR